MMISKNKHTSVKATLSLHPNLLLLVGLLLTSSQIGWASLVVRPNPRTGEFGTINSALNALKNFQGSQTIDIYPGTYKESLHITYKYPLTINGLTTGSRGVTVVSSKGAKSAGSNPASSTIWVDKDQFKMSNIKVINSYGTGTDTQAVALTVDGTQHVYENCVIESFQDSLLINTNGLAYFHQSVIIGAVDFIFGAGTAWFEKCGIQVKAGRGKSIVTAQRRPPGGSSLFVFSSSFISAYSKSPAPVGSVYLGRPWSPDASVIYQFCTFSDIVNSQGWSIWNNGDERTERVRFEEFRNSGAGAGTKGRKIGKQAGGAAEIGDVLGSGYNNWIN